MQALILAAGMGKRLGELTGENTKCMLKVNGIPLIDRTFEALRKVGITRLVMVTGYKSENLKKHIENLDSGIETLFVDNPDYATTNNIYSLFLASEYLCQDDTILLESDIIFEDRVLERIVSDPRPDLALVDKYESWMDGTVVKLNGDLSIASFITKKDFHYSDIGKYYKTVNIYKFSRAFSQHYYVPFLNAYCNALGRNEYYEQVLKVISLLDDCPMQALPLNGEKWYEIDDIQDLDIASSMFAPTAEAKWKAFMERFGGYWRYPHLKDFAYLVNPYFPGPNMTDELKASFEQLMRDYPSGMKVNSLLAAKNFSVKIDYILVGNGAAELIKALMENCSGKVGTIFPTFEEYPNRLEKSRIERFVPDNPDFCYTSDELIGYFSDKNIETLLVINPDNPSGNFLPREDMQALLDWSRCKGIRLIADESFVDFADQPYTLIDNRILENNPQLAVVKSISKSYGVPGLRLGVLASSDREMVAKMKKQVAIWNINSFAEFFMQIFEKYHSDYRKGCEKFRAERALFFEELQQIPWLRVIPSQANYFLCEVKCGMTSRELAIKLLSDNDILIKDCSGKDGFEGRSYIRIAVRDRNDNHLLYTRLKEIGK